MDKLKILIDYGNLSPDSLLYFRYTDWCGNQKFELRYWGDNGETPWDNEIKLTKNELKKLHELLKIGINSKKSDSSIATIKKYGKFVKVLNYFGSVGDTIDFQLTYTDWDGVCKYDLRHWEYEFSDCWRGVRMTENECKVLIKILDKEFGEENEFDKNINLKFLSSETLNNLCFGEGYCFKFLLKNNEEDSYEIEVMDIYANNFKIADYGLMYRVNEHENIVIEIYTYPSRDKLHNYQIHSIKDIKRIAFSIKMHHKNTNKMYITNQDISICT